MMQSSNEKKHNTDTMQSILLWEMKYHNAYDKPNFVTQLISLRHNLRNFHYIFCSGAISKILYWGGCNFNQK